MDESDKSLLVVPQLEAPRCQIGLTRYGLPLHPEFVSDISSRLGQWIQQNMSPPADLRNRDLGTRWSELSLDQLYLYCV